jgi:hypothetical protein
MLHHVACAQTFKERVVLIQKEYSEKDFKRLLHQREKKRNFVRVIIPILRNTYDIFANYLWAIVD